MKLRKVMALTLAGTMALAAVGCGSDASTTNDAPAASTATETKTETKTETATETAQAQETSLEDVKNLNDGKLVIWTLANDLIDFGERFQEKTGVEVETVVIEPANYPTKVQTALLGGESEPDIIVGEPKMLEDFYDAGFFEDLDAFGAQDYADEIVDYVWEVGQDADGIQRAISYQITPCGVFYRRDIAEKVFGTDDPEEIGNLFQDYDTILSTGETLRDAGYKIFASDMEMTYFSGDSAWVEDGKLKIDQARMDYLDSCVKLYQNDMTAYVAQWSTTWYQAMGGSVPVIDKETNVWDETEMEEAAENGKTTEIFAYGLPAWGVVTMRDHVGDLSGKWGVCAGPAYGFSGGTYIGISALSEKKELAWDFLKFCTLTEETLDWWIEASQGDVVSYLPCLEKHKEDENTVYGGEKLYQFFLEQAEGIDYSKVTKYDKKINDAWAAAIDSIKTGEKSKEDAVDEFYDVVASTYPEIEIQR